MKSLTDLTIHLNPKDHVAIARRNIPAGAQLATPAGEILTTRQSIPSGHKLALQPIAPGGTVLRYGFPIGVASQPIQPGDWVHSHNLVVGNTAREYTWQVVEDRNQLPGETERLYFDGFLRPDGRAGTRNLIAVIASVNCAAQAALNICRAFTPDRLADDPNVDGVIPIVHHTGCGNGTDSLSDRYLTRILTNLVHHPNISACLVVGLGCEICQLAALEHDSAVRRLNIQELGGFRKTVQAGIDAVEELLPVANACRRTRLPASKLTLALQCGGSDAWSGVTANPLVGLVVDRIVRQGGAAVLAETPEIFGAEQLLLDRVAGEAVARRLIERFEWWNDQQNRQHFSVDNNPSPGNKAGGLTTIFEKSLGAVAKGGSTPMRAVYEYAEKVTESGLVFMDTPGYDPVSISGEAAGGCNLTLFTTGRGTTLSGSIAPCIKVSSTGELAARLPDDIDFDAGRILEGAAMEDLADQLTGLLLRSASGERTKSECNGLPEIEFVPWQPGATL